MPPNPRKYLRDAFTAADNVAAILDGISLANYEKSLTLRSATERQFQILGEALYQLEKSEPDLTTNIPQSREIFRFRHILVHGYDKVDTEIVWGIYISKLPEFREAIRKLLESPGD